MHSRITHSDIARKLGIDKSTVSLAFSENPRISVATVKRVREMARQLGYRPDPIRSMLARDRWSGHHYQTGIGIAYLVHSGMPQLPQHRKFFAAAKARAVDRGYAFTEFDLAGYPDARGLARVLSARGIRGILLPQFMDDPGIGRMLVEQREFAVVCLDNGRWRLPFHHVSPNIFDATEMLWQQAVNRGYRRIGGAVLSHNPPAIDDWNRLGGSVVAQTELLQGEATLPLLRTGLDDYAAFERWLNKHQPDAVIGMLPYVHDWLIRAGARVPQDIGFAPLILDLKVPEQQIYSGFPAQDDAIAEAGVDILIGAILANHAGLPALQHKLLVDLVWHEGTTLPNKRERVGASKHDCIFPDMTPLRTTERHATSSR